MDPVGLTSSLLRGSTVFTGLIVLTLIFITIMGYTSSGESPAERRPPVLLVTIIACVGLVAVAVYFFPHLADNMVGVFGRVRAR